MSAYVVFIRDRIKDPKELELYGQKGANSADGVAILEFPTLQEARNWYHSPVYQAASVHRIRGADYRVMLVEGLPS